MIKSSIVKFVCIEEHLLEELLEVRLSNEFQYLKLKMYIHTYVYICMNTEIYKYL